MPTPASFAAFAVLAFVLIVAPGPSVTFVVSRGIALGRRAALITVAGNTVGVFAQVLLVAIGLGALLERSTALFEAIKIAGAIYLVYLGVQAIRHRSDADGQSPGQPTAKGTRSIFTEGLIVGVANPKAAVFFAAILPQYVNPTGVTVAVQMIVLGAVFVAIAFVSDSVWAIAAGSAQQWFARSPKRVGRFRVAGGMTMIALGLNLAVSGRPN